MVLQQATDATPKEVAERIGREYVESDYLLHEGNCYSEYRRIAHVVSRLFDQIPVPVEFQAEDPYADYADMARTVGRERKLRVYNQHTDHPYFSREEQLQFRAVHDWHGHLSADVDFSPEGEFRKWAHMVPHFTHGRDRSVMFAEVVGQVGAVHYLPDGFASDRYEQRAFVAPGRWIREMRDAVHG